MDNERSAGPYQLFMLGLCVYVLAALAAQTLFTLDPETVKILDVADVAVCVVFLADFGVTLVRTKNRWRYLITWGWLDFISSIPAIDVFRWGRAARIFRILRVLRGLRATRLLSTFVLERRAPCAFWAASLFAILVTIFGSIGILHLEQAEGSNIKTAEDAVWWSFVTITTVGYGDHFPVTSAGRVLAALLMFAGIGLFGTYTAFVASAFLAPGEKEQEREMAEIRREMRRLRESLSEDSPPIRCQ